MCSVSHSRGPLGRLIDAFQLLFDEPQQVVDRIQVLRDELAVFNMDGEPVFDESHEFEDAGGVDNALLQERVLRGQSICSLTEEEVVVDEIADLEFNRLH